MNWIKGTPKENGRYHLIYKTLKLVSGNLKTDLMVATFDKIDSYKKNTYFMADTQCEIQESKIVAWMPIVDIPAEFYDEQ